MSSAKRRHAVVNAQKKYDISERRACRAVGISQRVARYQPARREDEDVLHSRIIELACNYGRLRRKALLLIINEWSVFGGKKG